MCIRVDLFKWSFQVQVDTDLCVTWHDPSSHVKASYDTWRPHALVDTHATDRESTQVIMYSSTKNSIQQQSRRLQKTSQGYFSRRSTTKYIKHPHCNRCNTAKLWLANVMSKQCQDSTDFPGSGVTVLTTILWNIDSRVFRASTDLAISLWIMIAVSAALTQIVARQTRVIKSTNTRLGAQNCEIDEPTKTIYAFLREFKPEVRSPAWCFCFSRTLFWTQNNTAY